MSFIEELKRRNVFRACAAYLAGSWLLIEIAATIFPLYGIEESILTTLTTVLVIGFPLVAVVAWAYELTPEGLKRDSAVDRDAGATRRFKRKLDRAVIGVLALALALFAVDKFVLDPARDADLVEAATEKGRSDALLGSFGDRSIAVIPFVNLSSDPEQEFFSDGISEELLYLLTRIPELRVISRSSAFSFKGKNLDAPSVASRLKVAHILSGSVRKAGSEVRIAVQLVDGRSDTQIWSETYDRELIDIFAIQEDIAARVAGELRLRLLGETTRVAAADPEAYTAYLQGLHLNAKYTPEASQRAVALLQRAIEIDPDYAPAWRSLGNAYMTQVLLGLRSAEEAHSLARDAVDRALELDPEYAPTLTTLAVLERIYEQDAVAAARHLQRAIELEPNHPSVLWAAADFLEFLGRLDESIALKQHLVSLDPVEAGAYFSLGYSLYFARRYREAEENFRTSIDLQPDKAGSHGSLGVALLLDGRPEAALEAITAEPFEVYRQAGLAVAYHALGRTAESDAALEKLTRISAYEPYNIAWAHALRGENDQAFEWLLLELEQNGLAWMSVARLEPVFESLHGDPRWRNLLEKAGLTDEQLAVIDLAVPLPD